METFTRIIFLPFCIIVLIMSRTECSKKNSPKIRRNPTEDPVITIPQDRLKIHLAFVRNEERTSKESSAEMESAFKLSVQIINKEAKLANDHIRFTYTFHNDKSLCADDQRSQFINSTVVGIVGSFQNSCARLLNQKLGDENITQISYLPISSEISQTGHYPDLLSVSPEQKKQAQVIAAIIKTYGWKSVSIVEEESSTSLPLAIQLELEATDVSIENIIVVNYRTIDKQLDKIKQSSSRVIVMLVQESKEKERILKRAYDKGLMNKGWYWLVTGSFTLADMKAFSTHGETMQGFVGVYPRSGSGPAYHQLLSEWLKKRQNAYPGKIWSDQFEDVVGAYIPQVYDAVYAYYKALQSLVEKGINMTKIKSLRTALLNELKSNSNFSTAFTGATGEKVYFDPETRDGPPVYDVVNVQEGSWRKVGWHGHEGLTISRLIVWPGGNMNPKYSATQAEEFQNYKVLAVVMSVVMCIFLIMAVVLYRILLTHREKSRGLKVAYQLLSKEKPSYELAECKNGCCDEGDFDDVKKETNL